MTDLECLAEVLDHPERWSELDKSIRAGARRAAKAGMGGYTQEIIHTGYETVSVPTLPMWIALGYREVHRDGASALVFKRPVSPVEIETGEPCRAGICQDAPYCMDRGGCCEDEIALDAEGPRQILDEISKAAE